MGYTTPTTRAVGDLITASIWNTDVVENIKALKNTPLAYVMDTSLVDKSTTSSSWANTDATNLAMAITTEGTTDLAVFFSGVIGTSGANTGSQRAFLDFTIDGSRVVGNDDGSYSFLLPDAYDVGVNFIAVARNVAAGAHTIRLQWRRETASGTPDALTLYCNSIYSRPIMSAWKI